MGLGRRRRSAGRGARSPRRSSPRRARRPHCSVSAPYMPCPTVSSPSTRPGCSRKCSLIRASPPCSCDCAGVDPALRQRLGPVGAPSQDQQVGERVGAGSATVRAGRQPHRAEEISQLAHLPPGGGVGGVERVAGGEHDHQPAGTGQRQRLHDEMVVDRVLLTVMHRVVQPHVSERDVPDHQIKRRPRGR